MYIAGARLALDRGWAVRHINMRSILRRSILRAIAPLTLVLFPRRRVAGVQVIFTDVRAPRDRCLSSLEDALRLLSEVDPQNHRRVLRYARYVVVWAGHYFAADRRGGIYAAAPFLLDGEAAQVASLLVHEAVHLRLQRCGIRHHAANIARIERRCVREQASFLRRIPVRGEQWAVDVEDALKQEWWTERSRREHIEKVMRDLKMPMWMRPLVRALR